MLSAWATANRVVLGQEATDEKSNEIKAISKLLALLELRGCMVSIDAMGCQRAIAKPIIEQQGDYDSMVRDKVQGSGSSTKDGESQGGTSIGKGISRITHALNTENQ